MLKASKPDIATSSAKLPIKTGRSGPRSVSRVLVVLSAIADSGEGRTLAHLSGALCIPKSSLLVLLRSLVDLEFLVHESGRYHLASAAFEFASNIQSARPSQGETPVQQLRSSDNGLEPAATARRTKWRCASSMDKANPERAR
jgi:hypothetical protein